MDRDYNMDSNPHSRNGYGSQSSRGYGRNHYGSSDNYDAEKGSPSSYGNSDYDSGNYADGQSSYGNQGGYSAQDNYGERGYNDRSYGDRNYRDRSGYRSDRNERDSYRNQGSYRERYSNQGSYNQSYGNQGRYVRRSSKNSPLAPRRPKSSAHRPRPDVDPMNPDSFYKITGVLELHPNGYGFLRDPKENYVRQTSDPFVPGNVIEKLRLREGVKISGLVQPARGNQGPRVREIHDIDGIDPNVDPDAYARIIPFGELTPVTPSEWLHLETGKDPLSTRVIDILAPLGKGQRALIVAPPRSGKTVLLQQICQAVTLNHPEVVVIVLLIDERPEEVTDFERAVDAEVVASSLDCELESHIRLAQFVTQRCRRLAEMGKDVFLLLDSITRLARAFNKWVGNTGRTMTGGVDIKAMDIPKKIFSSARSIEGVGNQKGGSLTIVGTALVDTGSRMDELIFQEFKGTGNMELVLDRRLADRRVWPAIDVSKSGTRREELLLPPDKLRASNMLRRTLAPMDPIDAMERLTANLATCDSNQEFFDKFIR